jgi:predicted GNAT family N-acyltransferase
MPKEYCRAKNPAQCVDSNCPEKRGVANRLSAAVKAQDFDAFVAAKQAEAKPRKKINRVPKTRDALKAEIAKKYPSVTFHLNGSEDDYVVLDLISVPKNLRGQGVAKEIMQKLVDTADQNSWNLALTPSNDFGASKPRLEAFYRSYGFVKNAGRNKDFTTMNSMIRPKS